MERRKALNVLGLAGILACLIMLTAFAAEAPEPKWNSQEPAILGLEFPTSAAVAEKSVAATADECAEGLKWINDLLSPTAIPPGIATRMLALRGCLPAYAPGFLKALSSPGDTMHQEDAMQAKLTAGFIVKYAQPYYAIELIETRSQLIVGVRDLSGATPALLQDDRVAFVVAITSKFLRPQPADPPVVRSHTAERTVGWWTPRTRKPLSSGAGFELAKGSSNSPFVDVRFVTDGKSVVFEAYKALPFLSDYEKPRFVVLAQPPAVDSSYRKTPDVHPSPKQRH